MTREEILEYMEHRMDMNPQMMMTMYNVALLTNLGFSWTESGYMIEHFKEFSGWLAANYAGPEMEFPNAVVDDDQEEQIDYLKGLGCQYMQGYYFYRPMPVGDFESLIGSEANIDTSGFSL